MAGRHRHPVRPYFRNVVFVSYAIAISEALVGPITMGRNSKMITRGSFIRKSASAVAFTSFGIGSFHSKGALAVSMSNDGTPNAPSAEETTTIAYRSTLLDMQDFGVSVPVAMWYATPTVSSSSIDSPVRFTKTKNSVRYHHRISVKRIGELLTGWTFIPGFVAKDFKLEPTLMNDFVVDGQTVPLPHRGPVVCLAHGYLGSRFDLSHLAEKLAQQGFICVCPEYPESLAASYPRVPGLDRSHITDRMLEMLSSEFRVDATGFGIVGHSLGCGTAMSTGDDSWARVCIAGFPRASSSGPVLFLTSVNDGAVSLSRMGGKAAIPAEYVQLEESTMLQQSKLPDRAALVFDRPDAPNHISFLSEGVNDSMINLLSPLLPVAQALSVPVLDFDKYKVSRDSKETADVVIPLVTAYLKQRMV